MRNNGEIKVGTYVKAYIPEGDTPSPFDKLTTVGVVVEVSYPNGTAFPNFKVIRHDLDATTYMTVLDGWIVEYDNENEA